jgi:transposase
MEAVVLRGPKRRRLESLSRRTKDANLLVRCRVVLEVAAGVSRRQAAREIGCVPSTAWSIVTRYRDEGEASLVDPSATGPIAGLELRLAPQPVTST